MSTLHLRKCRCGRWCSDRLPREWRVMMEEDGRLLTGCGFAALMSCRREAGGLYLGVALRVARGARRCRWSVVVGASVGDGSSRHFSP